MSNFINDTLSRKIKRGEVFLSSFNASLAKSEFIKYRVETGASKVSLRFDAASTAYGEIKIYEDAVFSGPGIELFPVNMDFNSSNTLETNFYFAATTSSPGTLKFTSFRLPDNLVRLSPFDRDIGVVLKPNTEYAVVVTNSGPNLTIFTMTAFFREL